MQNTSALYKQIVALDNHWFVNKLVIDDVGTLNETDLFSLDTSGEAVDNVPQIGNAAAGEIDVKMVKPVTAIPRMGVLRPYFAAVGMLPQSTTAAIENDFLALTDAQITDNWLVPDEEDSGAYIMDDYLCFAATVEIETQSEWLPKGVYYVDTRSYSTVGNESVVVIHGYDGLLKFEQDYPNTDPNDWPKVDTDVVAEMANAAGVTVDSRTESVMTSAHEIPLPCLKVGEGETGDDPIYTMREVLENIASLYCANWIMTPEGKLLLVPLWGFDESVYDQSYLAVGTDALTLGNEGWFILV